MSFVLSKHLPTPQRERSIAVSQCDYGLGWWRDHGHLHYLAASCAPNGGLPVSLPVITDSQVHVRGTGGGLIGAESDVEGVRERDLRRISGEALGEER